MTNGARGALVFCHVLCRCYSLPVYKPLTHDCGEHCTVHTLPSPVALPSLNTHTHAAARSISLKERLY